MMKNISGIKEFEGFLKRKGLKFTPEREVIVKEIFSFHEHFDAETLYRRIKEKGYKEISLATVYRTLSLLMESRIIREVLRCRGRGFYEHVWGHKHHDHMICINCGKIIEFEDDRVEEIKEELCKKYGFKPVEYRLSIKGYCKECQKRLNL